MDNQRPLLYLALSFVLILLYQAWMNDYHAPEPVAVQQGLDESNDEQASGGLLPAATELAPSVTAAQSIVASAPESAELKTVHVRTDLLHAEISTKGATITKLELLEYPVSIDEQDTPLALISEDPTKFLVAQSGLVGPDANNSPSHLAVFAVDGEEFILQGDDDSVSIPFVWQNEQGIQVVKTLTFRANSYQIDVDYQVINGSESVWPVKQYRQLKRKQITSDEQGQFASSYIGGVVSSQEDVYKKVKFNQMQREPLSETITGGWVAMIQHYFVSSWIPASQDEKNTAFSRYLPNESRYIIGMESPTVQVPAGGQTSFSTKAFIGPKIQSRMAEVAPKLELTVDYGWLTIIAQPMFWLLKFFHSVIGNWGWAIVLVTLSIKALFYKLSESSYKSMAKMKALQPKMAELKERYGDDREKMGRATMELYQKEKVNPLGGCLPMLIQIPFFIALYWVLMESVELRQAPWILWIRDLSIQDPYFILPIIMALSMFAQQKLNPAPVDPIQQQVFMFMPLIFGVFFAFFPAGLVLYWVVNNLLSIAQQYYITKYVIKA